VETLKDTLLNSSPARFAKARPRLAAWIVLSAALCTFLAIEGRQVVLAVGQWLALFLACVLVAGLCVRIVSGRDDAPTTPPPPTRTGDTSD
jgi:purine-cytosine permease-like protein